MADEIVLARVLLPNLGHLLATKICEFLANFNSENSGKDDWMHIAGKSFCGRSTKRMTLNPRSDMIRDGERRIDNMEGWCVRKECRV